MVDKSGKALVEHWSWAAKKGLMNQNTANGIKAAVSQVMKVLDDWETVNIEELNVEELLTRFQNLKLRQFKPQVLETYKRRFRLAHASYLAYLQDPGNWRPKTLAPRQTARNGERERNEPQERTRETPREHPAANLVEFPYPIRDGQIARLILPRDLTLSEVRRLTAFMRTLTVDFAPED